MSRQTEKLSESEEQCSQKQGQASGLASVGEQTRQRFGEQVVADVQHRHRVHKLRTQETTAHQAIETGRTLQANSEEEAWEGRRKQAGSRNGEWLQEVEREGGGRVQ